MSLISVTYVFSDEHFTHAIEFYRHGTQWIRYVRSWTTEKP